MLKTQESDPCVFIVSARATPSSTSGRGWEMLASSLPKGSKAMMVWS